MPKYVSCVRAAHSAQNACNGSAKARPKESEHDSTMCGYVFVDESIFWYFDVQLFTTESYLKYFVIVKTRAECIYTMQIAKQDLSHITFDIFDWIRHSLASLAKFARYVVRQQLLESIRWTSNMKCISHSFSFSSRSAFGRFHYIVKFEANRIIIINYFNAVELQHLIWAKTLKCWSRPGDAAAAEISYSMWTAHTVAIVCFRLPSPLASFWCMVIWAFRLSAKIASSEKNRGGSDAARFFNHYFLFRFFDIQSAHRRCKRFLFFYIWENYRLAIMFERTHPIVRVLHSCSREIVPSDENYVALQRREQVGIVRRQG